MTIPSKPSIPILTCLVEYSFKATSLGSRHLTLVTLYLLRDTGTPTISNMRNSNPLLSDF